MSVSEIAKRVKESNWKDLTAREASVIKSYMALMNDPSGALFNALADRADGKLPTPVSVGGDDNLGPIRIEVAYVDSEEASAAPGAEAGEE
jgi:hypothetical protein